jgi:hypothetical protein
MGLLKDGAELLLSTWRAVRERSAISISQSIAGWAKSWTVNEWHHPYDAVRDFGERGWVQRREELSEKGNQLTQKFRAEVQRMAPEKQGKNITKIIRHNKRR